MDSARSSQRRFIEQDVLDTSDRRIRDQHRYARKRQGLTIILVTFAILLLAIAVMLSSIQAVVAYFPSHTVDSLQHPLPIFIPAVMTSLTAIALILTTKFQRPCVLLTGIFFNISACIVSLANMMSMAITAVPLFKSFVHFRYLPMDRVCIAYTRHDYFKKTSNDTDSGVMFPNLSNCSVIEFTLPPITLMLVFLYLVTCVLSCLGCIALSTILCFAPGNPYKRDVLNDYEMSALPSANLASRDDEGRVRRLSSIHSNADTLSYHERVNEHNEPPSTFSALGSSNSSMVTWSYLPQQRPIACEAARFSLRRGGPRSVYSVGYEHNVRSQTYDTFKGDLEKDLFVKLPVYQANGATGGFLPVQSSFVDTHYTRRVHSIAKCEQIAPDIEQMQCQPPPYTTARRARIDSANPATTHCEEETSF